MNSYKNHESNNMKLTWSAFSYVCSTECIWNKESHIFIRMLMYLLIYQRNLEYKIYFNVISLESTGALSPYHEKTHCSYQQRNTLTTGVRRFMLLRNTKPFFLTTNCNNKVWNRKCSVQQNRVLKIISRAIIWYKNVRLQASMGNFKGQPTLWKFALYLN